MIEYIKRSAAYYSAQGYKPYQWAHFEDVPFAAMQKPLNKSRLGLITTAAPFRADLPDQGPGAAYNADAKFFEVFTAPISPKPDLRISHIGYDRKHCEAKDPNTWLPIDALQAAKNDGAIGDLADTLIGVPTNRSQRVTLEKDAEAALITCKNLAVDVALLVPT